LEAFIKLIELFFVAHGSYVLPIIFGSVLSVIVYFKYVKPFYLKMKRSHEILDKLDEVSKQLLTNDSDEHIKIIEKGITILNGNKDSISDIVNDLKHLEKEIASLNRSFLEHDRSYEKQLNALTLEFRTLMIKVETNIYSMRGIK